MNLRSRINHLERALQARSRLKEPELIIAVTDFRSGENRIIFPPERAGQLAQSHNELTKQT